MKVFDKTALSLVYTPGVGKNCKEIQRAPELLFDYTNVANSVVLLSDDSNVKNLNVLWLQLEMLSAMVKKITNVDAYPLILDPKYTKTDEDYIETVDNLLPAYKVICCCFMDLARINKLRAYFK